MTEFKIGDKVIHRYIHRYNDINFVGIVDNIHIGHANTIDVQLSDGSMVVYSNPDNWELHFEFEVDDIVVHSRPMPKFKQVIYNNPATIIFWEDGTKTVVKCDGEKYDELKGLMMGIVKKVCGLKNFYTYYDIITKYVTGKNKLLSIEKGLAERYVMNIYHIKKINSKDDIYNVAMTDGFYVSTERK